MEFFGVVAVGVLSWSFSGFEPVCWSLRKAPHSRPWASSSYWLASEPKNSRSKQGHCLICLISRNLFGAISSKKLWLQCLLLSSPCWQSLTVSDSLWHWAIWMGSDVLFSGPHHCVCLVLLGLHNRRQCRYVAGGDRSHSELGICTIWDYLIEDISGLLNCLSHLNVKTII